MQTCGVISISEAIVQVVRLQPRSYLAASFNPVTTFPQGNLNIAQQTMIMADPLSIAASELAVITAAVQSTKSLQGTVKRFRNRDKTLRLLQNELDDLTNILESLQQVTNNERSILALLQGHIDWCNQICSEIEQSIKVFSGKSKTGLLDWAKMELMRGDISEFIDTIAGYKSTISVGLGTITMSVTRSCSLHFAIVFHEDTLPRCRRKFSNNIMR